ncbi:phospholipid phosphatase 1 isoform X2 [Arapaima gigas]
MLTLFSSPSLNIISLVRSDGHTCGLLTALVGDRQCAFLVCESHRRSRGGQLGGLGAVGCPVNPPLSSVLSLLPLAGLPFATLTLLHRPYKRGFFCNDDSITFPLKEDTIPYQLLAGTVIPFALLVMITGECLSVHFKRIKSKSSFNNSYVACVYKAVGTFLFGAAMSQSLTDIAKYSIGRLRPHFLDICRPIWSQINCTSGSYIENFTCTGDKTMVNEAR